MLSVYVSTWLTVNATLAVISTITRYCLVTPLSFDGSKTLSFKAIRNLKSQIEKEPLKRNLIPVADNHFNTTTFCPSDITTCVSSQNIEALKGGKKVHKIQSGLYCK